MINSTTILQKRLQFKKEELNTLIKNEKKLIKKMSAEKSTKTNDRVSLIAARVAFKDGVERKSSLFQATFINKNLDNNRFKKAVKKFCKGSLKAQATQMVEDTTTAGYSA